MSMVRSALEKSGNSRSPILLAMMPMLLAMASALVRFRCRRGGGSGLLGGGLGLLVPVFPELGQHAPLLLLPGDLDQDVLRDRGVLAAFVPDLLGEPVEREGLRDGGLGFADDGRQLLLLVGVVVHEPLEGLGLLHGVQVLAEEVLHQGDLGVVCRRR